MTDATVKQPRARGAHEEVACGFALRFFGVVSASISHEIKNRMAVINEQAGLLEDIVRMAEKGRPLDLERVMRLAGALKSQVTMTDDIIRNMNRFSHSVDRFWRPVDLGEWVGLVVNLFKRMNDNRGLAVSFSSPVDVITLDSAPFLLMNLLGLCMDGAADRADRTQPVVLRCLKTGDGGCVEISFTPGAGPDPVALPDAVDELAALLCAEVVLADDQSAIRVNFPAGA